MLLTLKQKNWQSSVNRGVSSGQKISAGQTLMMIPDAGLIPVKGYGARGTGLRIIYDKQVERFTVYI